MSLSMAGTGSSSRLDSDLTTSVKKAVSSDETAPKRKHVRACIVYTWDHKSGLAFWAAAKLQPFANEVQVFKTLITIHKLLQEGHPSVLKEAQRHVGWIESLGRGISGDGPVRNGYGKLNYRYSNLLLMKLTFHKLHTAFNGTFEYEDYISLRTINDPNEGYEAILDLMNLQDAIDDYQRLIFTTLKTSYRAAECRISSLVPMLAESYGIYRFLVSMLRAMNKTTDDQEILQPLRERFCSQHTRLLDFYYDCSTLKYLTSLVTIPVLSQEPPQLVDEDANGPALPQRPKLEIEATGSTLPRSNSRTPQPEPTGDWWKNNELQAQMALQQQQQQQQLLLQQQQQQQAEAQLWAQQHQQAQIAQQQAEQQAQRVQLMQQEQQRLFLESQRATREALERDIMGLRGNYDQSQLMLEQYDRRVKALETELMQLNENSNSQLSTKNELIQSLQEQVSSWKTKYESLAKLYSQIRQEHLDLLGKYKQAQTRAASAQEAIEKRERIERELKAKNLELADMIRERDRARYDLDKSKGAARGQVEQVERELRMTRDKVEELERSKEQEISALILRHARELDELEGKVRQESDIEKRLAEKTDENEILQETISGMESALRDLKVSQDEEGQAMDEQLGDILKEQLARLKSIVDQVLELGATSIQDSMYALESPLKTGNQNATATFVLTLVEQVQEAGFEFATAFNAFIADGPNGDHAHVIRTVFSLTGGLREVLDGTKGFATRSVSTDDRADELIRLSNEAASSACDDLLFSLVSSKLQGLSDDETTEIVINGNIALQQALQKLTRALEQAQPSTAARSGDLSEIVETEMEKAAAAINSALAKLSELSVTVSDPVHSSILEAARAVANAIGALLKAATDCQNEIVAQGRGGDTRTAFYKKNSRWTEGLISAARAVAGATNDLIGSADGTLAGSLTLEHVIVACNEVAASTAQLVAASRVKATLMSPTQHTLEKCSRSVTSACRSLVDQVQRILGAADDAPLVNYDKMPDHDFKTKNMEQQVHVLKLENELAQARRVLGEIRRVAYERDVEEENDQQSVPSAPSK